MRNLKLLLLASLIACGSSTDISKFTYGKGQPGANLPEGGEIRHENVRILGMPEQTWVMVYQYTGPSLADTAPFANNADPAQTGNGMYGGCVDERQDLTWPFTPITGGTYLTLSKVNMTGAGTPTGGLNIIETNPPNTSGNSTFRHYDFTYGGGAPGDMKGFNASMTTAAMSTPGTDYMIDIGKAGCADTACDSPAATDSAMQYHMPEAYTTPLGIGGGTAVTIPAGQDLEMTWDEPANDFGTDGHTHTRNTHFNFTFFADPTNATNPPQFICFPDKPGHQVVPAAVINALPKGGLIVNADLSHYMEAREAASGEMRRFDLVSIYCNISSYSIQ